MRGKRNEHLSMMRKSVFDLVDPLKRSPGLLGFPEPLKNHWVGVLDDKRRDFKRKKFTAEPEAKRVTQLIYTFLKHHSSGFDEQNERLGWFVTAKNGAGGLSGSGGTAQEGSAPPPTGHRGSWNQRAGRKTTPTRCACGKWSLQVMVTKETGETREGRRWGPLTHLHLPCCMDGVRRSSTF